MAVQLTVAKRQSFGNQVKALRRQGITPANIICKGKDSCSIQADNLALEKAIHQAGYTQPLELQFKSGEPVTVLVIDIKFQPAKGTLQHVTFQEVKRGQKVTAEVPIVLVGEPPGLQQGLILIQTLYSVEVEAGALSLPENFEVDVSGLEDNGQTVRLDAIKLPAEVAIQAELEEPVARLEMPRLQVSQAQEETEAAQAADDEQATETDGDSTKPASDSPAESALDKDQG